MTTAQRTLIHTLLGRLTVTAREDKLRALSHLCSREVETSRDLTAREFRTVADHLQAVLGWPEDERTKEVDILTRPADDPWADSDTAA